jgi:hypothetical protein
MGCLAEVGLLGLWSIKKVSWGRYGSRVIHVVVGSSLLVTPCGYWLEASLSSLPHEPLHRVTHNRAAVFLQRKLCKGYAVGKSLRKKPQSFCYLLLEVTSYHLCHNTFI